MSYLETDIVRLKEVPGPLLSVLCKVCLRVSMWDCLPGIEIFLKDPLTLVNSNSRKN